MPGIMHPNQYGGSANTTQHDYPSTAITATSSSNLGAIQAQQWQELGYPGAPSTGGKTETPTEWLDRQIEQVRRRA